MTQSGHGPAVAPTAKAAAPTTVRIVRHQRRADEPLLLLRRSRHDAAARQAQARKPDAEQRAPPLVQQRIDSARAEHVRGLDHVAGRVARSGQRGRELRVGRLGCGRRRKPERRLARGMELVPQPAQGADRLVVVEQVGSSRKPSSRTSVCESSPQSSPTWEA